MKKVNIAIVGATGMVGRTFLKVLEERDFPVNNLYLFASSRSKGKKLKFKNKEYSVEELNETSFNRDIHIALFSAGSEVSKKYAPIAKENGVIVVDNSSAWRMDKDVPLIVPEVNPEDIKWHNGIISNPNCSTIQCVVPIKPLHDKFKIKRIVYSTYQAVSGSGMGGIKDLENGIEGKPCSKYPHQIAFNCLPHIDIFMENKYTKEEMKIINETQKILNDYNIKITATAVRIPVRYGHSVATNIEFENPFELKDIYKTLKTAKGVILKDDIENNIYPLPLEAEDTDEVYVGRIRRDFSVDNGVNLWIVADNIRKGAATNTVQIAELLLQTI
ncbi:aspartate-semialdehyde dehydrogenase [Caldisalinibacter kiritimatiensis]|uniref:Aspartate-semialdehyde dehydrogenase n=1 Tax=Caldisalinibacter kiritimatiensis TaxID=1304284 RepID=R1AUR5_9FIRM|nr:aspartate-semialdehyde dehydrogenase [Caldisalinibacter kiritimatiensis]EOD00893.1 Aspartate-semialdehyde dehydrogenase [Caldisalinibacter kiritimatiensis]